VLAPEIARSLAPAAAVLEHDMRLVSAGRDAESAARDPALARYRADRAVAEIALVLLDALVALTPDLPFNGADASIRALVRGAFGCIDPDADLQLIRLARAALSTWVEHLLTLASKPATRALGSGVARELDAFADAFAVELPKR